jgi:menaquinone-dependent protoporphyrinogen oxidase
MMILIAYASVEGQTRKIADHIAQTVESAGHGVVLADLAQPGFALPARFDAAIVCGPIHMGNYPSTLIDFLRNWKSALQSMPAALVTVSLSIASENADERAEAAAYPDKLFDQTGWRAGWVHNAKGALRYLEYDFFKRWMLRRIAAKEGGPVDTSQDHELTDFVALDAFVHEFLAGTAQPH